MIAPAPSTSFFWWSHDGLRLHAKYYSGPEPSAEPKALDRPPTEGATKDRPTFVCVPGLTRNSRDFEPISALLAAHGPIYALDLRGRGDSAWAKDTLTYGPLAYVQDVERLITGQALTKVILIGTSLGGIVSMLLAGLLGERLIGAVLNDIGPTIEPQGLQRIRGYVGKQVMFPSWMHCAQFLAENNADIYPDYTIHDWLGMAKRLACIEPSGRIMFDYDPKIAEPFKLPSAENAVDLWPAFDVLAQRPLLVVRGERSDILSAETLAQMGKRAPGVTTVTIPHVGHAPVLNEPSALAALQQFCAHYTAD